MKKFVSLLLSLVLALSCVSAFAAEVNWSDIEGNAAELIAMGEFVTLDEVAVKLWIPSVMPAVELTEEDTEVGTIACFATEDGVYCVAVNYVDVNGMTLDEVKAVLPDYGATEIEDAVINGLPAVTYALADNDNGCVAFVTAAGYILELVMTPVSDEGFAPIASLVAASIQTAE